MSDIDLSAAIDAVMVEMGFDGADDGAMCIEWYRDAGSEKADVTAVGGDRNLVGVMLDAAAPLIEAAVREQIARDIEAVASAKDRIRPLAPNAEVRTDFANDFQWAALVARGLP